MKLTDFMNDCDSIYRIVLKSIEKYNASDILCEIRKRLPKYKLLEINSARKLVIEKSLSSEKSLI